MTATDKDILTDFFSKRKLFDQYIKENALPLFTCPGCGYPSPSVRDSYEICEVCNWEDDGTCLKHIIPVFTGIGK